MRLVLVATVLLGCAVTRTPEKPVIAAPRITHEPTSGELIDPSAPSLDEAHARVRRHLRDIGIRSPPKCVCEPVDMGSVTVGGTVHRLVATQCSWYR